MSGPQRGLFEVEVNPTAPPVSEPAQQSPSGIAWRKDSDVPVSGSTPAARHASATGAAVATAYSGTREQQLLVAFLKGTLTIAAAAEALNIKEGSVCGPWSRLEKKGLIEGTKSYFTWESDSGAPVRREWHRLTAAGRQLAEGLSQDLDAKRQGAVQS